MSRFSVGGDASSLTVTLHRGSSSGPVVATLEGPGTIANNEQVTFVAPAGTVLQPDSVYVLKMVDPASADEPPYLSLTTRRRSGGGRGAGGLVHPQHPYAVAVRGEWGLWGWPVGVEHGSVATDGGVSELGVVDVGQVFVTGSHHEGGYLLDSVGVRFDATAGVSDRVSASLGRVGASVHQPLVELGSVVGRCGGCGVVRCAVGDVVGA